MANQVLEIEGIQETLKLLNDIDPKYRRLVTKQIKAAGQVIISEARQMVASYDNSKGNGAPLSGMVRGNLVKGRETTWRTDAVQKGFKIKVGVRGSKERYVNFNRTDDRGSSYTEQVVFGAKPYRLMTVQSLDAAGVIYDHAGAQTQGTFVTNLEAQSDVGGQPRVIDVAVDKNRPAVQAEVLDVVKQVEKITNRQMKVR
jgi:hypothetical protein